MMDEDTGTGICLSTEPQMHDDNDQTNKDASALVDFCRERGLEYQRVINQGDCASILKLKLPKIWKLQIVEYVDSNCPADVILTVLTETKHQTEATTNITDLHCQLTDYLRSMPSLSLFDTVSHAVAMLEVHFGPCETFPVTQEQRIGARNRSTKKSPMKSQRKQNAENLTTNTVGAKMKTAEDVIKRIKWDPDFRTQHFIVGYLDRFVGTIEKPFDDFTWGDFVSQDLRTTVAIPQHRIQYFKYRTFIVWDRAARIDHIFNSLDSTVDIYEAMRAEDEKAGDSVCGVTTPQEETMDASDNEENFQTTDNEPGAVLHESTSKRPNYYLYIPVDDAGLQVSVSNAQACLKEQFPTAIRGTTKHLHITLALFLVDDGARAATIDTIKQAIHAERKALAASLLNHVVTLNIAGLDMFTNSVIYAKLDQEKLKPFLSHLIAVLLEAGVPVIEVNTLHLTIARLNRNLGVALVNAIKAALNVSRLNAQCIVDYVKLREIGSNTTEDYVCFDYCAASQEDDEI